MKLGDKLYFEKYEAKDITIDNKTSRPAAPVEGQMMFNMSTKRMEYYSGTTAQGKGWVTIDQQNIQVLKVTGEMTGTQVGADIPVTASSSLITNRTSTSDLNGASAFLYYDATDNTLKKLLWETIESYISSQNTLPDLISGSYLGDRKIEITNGFQANRVRLAGTDNQIVITSDSTVPNRLIWSLPNSVTVSEIRVTDLYINGVKYTPYVHPTQPAINVNGTGLQFVQAGSVNTLGHTTSLTLGTIPTASEAIVGVTRLATNAEATSGASGVALQPSQVGSFQSAWGYKTEITVSTDILHKLDGEVTVECYNKATGETIYPTIIRIDKDELRVELGSITITTVVLIRRVL